MGTFSVPIEIGNPDGTQYETIRALVDTGASYTTVPAPLLRELEVPVHDQVAFILADDRRIRRDVGRTWIRIDGRSEITLVLSQLGFGICLRKGPIELSCLVGSVNGGGGNDGQGQIRGAAGTGTTGRAPATDPGWQKLSPSDR